MKLSKKIVSNDYSKLKKLAFKLYKHKDYYGSLEIINLLSIFMYNFNVIYTDNELDILVKNISKQTLKIKKFHKQNNDKNIIFYDWFALDDRGLTLIYLKSLIELGYNIKYITYKKNSNLKMKNILDLINSKSNCQIYRLKSEDFIKGSKELIKVIQDYKPSKVLIHTIPNDIICSLVFSIFDCFERYLINITDHAFWLGKYTFDFLIEFRGFGYDISKMYRKIEKERLIILPYYPMNERKQEFKGFPFNYESKKIIFSGGSLYKIRNSTIFYNIIKHIIETHQNTVFLFAGNGDSSEMENFIRKNNYYKKVYYIKERNDLPEIMKRSCLYLSTFPIAGGLMAQYAVINGKIPMTYVKDKSLGQDVEELFINLSDCQFSYDKLEEFYREIDLLIDDDEYRKSKEKKLLNKIIEKEQFTLQLKNCLEGYFTNFDSSNFKYSKPDINKLSLEFIGLWDFKKYCTFLVDYKNYNLFKYFPIKYSYGKLYNILNMIIKDK